MHEIRDFQTVSLTISNDATEQTIYSYTIPANSISGYSLFRLQLAGQISSKASAPGTITLKTKFGALTASVMDETILGGVAASKFVANLDWWMVPGSGDVVATGGFFAQNSSDLFSPAGPRIHSAVSAEDFSIDNTITVTFQFGTADPANVFVRSLAALIVMTG